MPRKTIAIDIDDVLAINVPAFIAFSNQRWGTNLTVEDFTEDWAAMWRIDRDTLKSRIKEIDDRRLVVDFECHPQAVQILRRLKKDYKLVVTTSRRRELVSQTTDWISAYFPDVFEEVHYAGIWDGLKRGAHQATKASLCRQIGADYLIDDQTKHCFAAAEAGIPSLLFGDYPWNHADSLPNGVVRVNDWQAVEDYFNGQS